jgi:hypothetical protein
MANRRNAFAINRRVCDRVLAVNPARDVKTEKFSRTEDEVQTVLDAVETSTHTRTRTRIFRQTLWTSTVMCDNERNRASFAR